MGFWQKRSIRRCASMRTRCSCVVVQARHTSHDPQQNRVSRAEVMSSQRAKWWSGFME